MATPQLCRADRVNEGASPNPAGDVSRMSDYWDAIARATLDIPAAAVPRPESMFEGDLVVGDEQPDAERTAMELRSEPHLLDPQSRPAIRTETRAAELPVVREHVESARQVGDL